jgi:hypothetical protein
VSPKRNYPARLAPLDMTAVVRMHHLAKVTHLKLPFRQHKVNDASAVAAVERKKSPVLPGSTSKLETTAAPSTKDRYIRLMKDAMSKERSRESKGLSSPQQQLQQRRRRKCVYVASRKPSIMVDPSKEAAALNSSAAADPFAVGCSVLFDKRVRGTVRYVGPAQEFKKQRRVYGIELNRKSGNHDGKPSSKRYFRTKPGFGVLALKAQLAPLADFTISVARGWKEKRTHVVVTPACDSLSKLKRELFSILKLGSSNATEYYTRINWPVEVMLVNVSTANAPRKVANLRSISNNDVLHMYVV